MPEKRVAVFLRDGSSVVSEDMEEDAAQAEFDRIVDEKPGTGFAKRIIKVGNSAAFQSGDFARIEIQDAQGPYLA